MMLLLDARRQARFRDGELVLLADQDRSLLGHRRRSPRVGRCSTGRSPGAAAGPYVVQAAIASLHADEPRDWPQIAALYGELARLTDSPVVELNRAVAVAEAQGPEAGLDIVDRLDARRLPLPARDAGRAAAPARSHRRGPRRLPAGAGARPRRRRAAAARAPAVGALRAVSALRPSHSDHPVTTFSADLERRLCASVAECPWRRTSQVGRAVDLLAERRRNRLRGADRFPQSQSAPRSGENRPRRRRARTSRRAGRRRRRRRDRQRGTDWFPHSQSIPRSGGRRPGAGAVRTAGGVRSGPLR